MTRLDEYLPEFDYREIHETAVAAAPAAAIAAAKATAPDEMPLVRALFTLRSLPALVTRGRGMPTAKGRPLAEQMIAFGFVPLADGEDEIVLGFVGQPWRLSGGSMPRLRTVEAWSSFADPGFVKAVINFRSDGQRLETETRIKATDPRSRRRFAPYWRVIRPWSGLIRRSWLRAAKRRLEQSAR